MDMLIEVIRDTHYVDLITHPIGVDNPFPGDSMDIPKQSGLWLLLVTDVNSNDCARTMYLVPLLCPACKQTVHYTDDVVTKLRERLQGCILVDILYMEQENIIFGEIFADLDVQSLPADQNAHGWLQLVFVDEGSESGKILRSNGDDSGLVLSVHPLSFFLTRIYIDETSGPVIELFGDGARTMASGLFGP